MHGDLNNSSFVPLSPRYSNFIAHDPTFFSPSFPLFSNPILDHHNSFDVCDSSSYSAATPPSINSFLEPQPPLWQTDPFPSYPFGAFPSPLKDLEGEKNGTRFSQAIHQLSSLSEFGGRETPSPRKTTNEGWSRINPQGRNSKRSGAVRKRNHSNSASSPSSLLKRLSGGRGPNPKNGAKEGGSAILYSNNKNAAAEQSADEWQSQFFRTKFCPYHLEGRCINGSGCRFAHTAEDIRPLPDLHRTKLCESYVKKTKCTEGNNCPFAHDPSQLRTSSHSFYKVTLCNFYRKGRCWNGAHCRFAHGAVELQRPRDNNRISDTNFIDKDCGQYWKTPAPYSPGQLTTTTSQATTATTLDEEYPQRQNNDDESLNNNDYYISKKLGNLSMMEEDFGNYDHPNGNIEHLNMQQEEDFGKEYDIQSLLFPDMPPCFSSYLDVLPDTPNALLSS